MEAGTGPRAGMLPMARLRQGMVQSPPLLRNDRKISVIFKYNILSLELLRAKTQYEYYDNRIEARITDSKVQVGAL